MGWKTNLTALIGVGAVAGTVIDRALSGSWWWQRFPQTVSQPAPTVMIPVDNRPLAEIKNELAQRLQNDQTTAMRTLAVVKNISEDIQKNYPLDQNKLTAQLYGISTQRINNATQDKNQAKAQLQQIEQRKALVEAQLEALRRQKASLTTFKFKKVGTGLYSVNGKVVEEPELERLQRAYDLTSGSRSAQIVQQISMLEAELSRLAQDPAVLRFQRADNQLATALEERKTIAYVS